ncbi:MAG TPA: hypothetical protein VNV87_04495 [Acidimicrobiales bacterium]|nr:hypothetical protein [Acidimicrobiales bacterium]
MALTGRTGTVEDGLGKVYTDIASLQLLPDSAPHAQFLSQLQMVIQKYLTAFKQKAQQQQMQAGQALAGGQVPGGGQPGQPPGGGMGAALPPPPGPAQFGPGGAGGGGSPGNVQMPNPDELRRVLAGSSGMAG